MPAQTGYVPSWLALQQQQGYVPMNGAYDEAALRAANQPPPTQYTVDPSQNSTVLYDANLGGTNVTRFGSGPAYSNDQMMADLQQQSANRNLGGVSTRPEDTSYWAAIHPNATQAEIDAHAKEVKSYDLAHTPAGQRGIRGWMNRHPVGVMAAFIAAAAGGAAASGYFGGGAGAGTGAAAPGGGLASGVGGTGASGAPAAASGGGGAMGFGGAGTGGIPANIGADFASVNIGGGAPGALASSGGISGGAGTGFLGSTGNSGLLANGGQQLRGYYRNANTAYGALSGGGGDSSGTAPSYMPSVGMFGSQMQQAAPTPAYIGLPAQTPIPYIPARGYRVRDFNGAKIWT